MAGTDPPRLATDLASPASAAGGGTGRRDCSVRKETAGTMAARPGKGGRGSTPSGRIRPDLVRALSGWWRRVLSGGRHQRVCWGEQRRQEDVRRGAEQRGASGDTERCGQRWRRWAAGSVRRREVRPAASGGATSGRCTVEVRRGPCGVATVIWTDDLSWR
uniref:Uncharacterized protein n=1 Tax=Oryza meridionalis TaxID=40149 RepID=A0A0E0DCZ5_9ORYZ